MSAVRLMLEDVHAYRELLLALAYRDIRVKYKQAAFGVLWVFFMPCLAILSGLLFRLAMAFFKAGDLSGLLLADVAAVMVKSLPWLLFATIVSSASSSLVGSASLITKIYFPREVVPLAAGLSALLDFAIAAAGLVVVLAALTLVAPGPVVHPSPWLLLIPALLAVLVVLATGLGLLLAAANVFFRDVKYIVAVLLQFGMFFSLVYFTHEELGRFGWVLLLNPAAPLLEGLRLAVVGGSMPASMWPWLAYSVAVAVCLLWVACAVFERTEYLFAEYA